MILCLCVEMQTVNVYERCQKNMEQKKEQMRWWNSIQAKQFIVFLIIVIFLALSSTYLQGAATKLAIETTYEKMDANVSYFVESLESELLYVHQLQLDIFNDRRLPFLESPKVNINGYEKRDYLLSIKERIQTIAGISKLVENVILYFPESDYRIDKSNISRIQQNCQEELEQILSMDCSRMFFDGNSFWLMEKSGTKIKNSTLPKEVLVVSFSTNELKKRLSNLNTSENMGSFFYLEEGDYLLSGQDLSYEKEIYEKLQMDEDGNYLNVQRLQIDGRNYLICVKRTDSIGTFVQYTEETPMMKEIYRFRRIQIVIILIMIALAAFFIFYIQKFIHRPIRILLKAFEQTRAGNWKNRIKHVGKDEFSQLYEGFNGMQEQTEKLINEVYVQTNLAQRAQLMQLQAQINPHFLYNSFFILSRRIKREDYDNAELLAEHLGEYFQFLTRNESDDIMLKRETAHAKCYANIQGARFAGRIRVEFEELPEEYAGIHVPRLILQPLMENVFEHGLYNKSEDGIVRVSFAKEDGDKIIVTVEDNGEELTDEILMSMRQSLESEEEGEITGIINIHKRLRIYFPGEGGLRLDRSELGGLKTEVVIGGGGRNDREEFTDHR